MSYFAMDRLPQDGQAIQGMYMRDFLRCAARAIRFTRSSQIGAVLWGLNDCPRGLAKITV